MKYDIHHSVEKYPFLISYKYFDDKKTKNLFISREGWKDFQLKIIFGGRASFAVNVPRSWKTQGLGGMQKVIFLKSPR